MPSCIISLLSRFYKNATKAGKIMSLYLKSLFCIYLLENKQETVLLLLKSFYYQCLNVCGGSKISDRKVEEGDAPFLYSVSELKCFNEFVPGKAIFSLKLFKNNTIFILRNITGCNSRIRITSGCHISWFWKNLFGYVFFFWCLIVPSNWGLL